MSKNRQAFTIFELIVTLALISVTAAVCITHYFGRSEITLENASVLLAQDLRTTQNRCAFLRESAAMEFFEDGDGYQTLGESGQTLINPRTGRAFVRRYSSDGVFRGVRVSAVSFGRQEGVRFDSYGTLESGAWIELEFRGEKRRLVLEAGSGKIRILGSETWADPGF